MRQTLTRPGGSVNLGWKEVVFEVAEARRALPYVARVAKDACNAYQQVMECRAALESRISQRERKQLDEHREECLRRLNAAIDEFNAVGADLLDMKRGVIRFNVRINGRRASLLWSIDESIESAWEDFAIAGA